MADIKTMSIVELKAHLATVEESIRDKMLERREVHLELRSRVEDLKEVIENATPADIRKLKPKK